MKKLFLLAVGLAMTLTACQKDEGLVSDVATTSSFTVTIPQSGVQTRAVTDAFGTGTSVNRCILEIYHGDKLYDRIEKGVSGKTVTFDNLRLVSSQTYDFVFWADCAEGSEGNFTDKVYNTANLKSITEIGPFVGNSDERDAFFAKESFKVTGSFTKPVTLKRPFGLLVVKTNDLNEIKDEALKPTGYSVAFKGLPTTFNALTGEVSGSADVTYTAGELAKADGTISMDFLWATESEAALSDFTMTFLNNGTAICTNDAFTNIPIRRNYRTNVSGNLLTKKGSISVTIDPNFDANSPIDKVIAEVESVSEVAQAIENGATDITVTTAPTTAATIEIPHTLTAEQAAKEISITLPETDQQVTLAYTTEQNGQAPEAVNITVPTTNKLIINLPESTVTLNGTSYTAVEATTAGNTLIVPEGVTVGKLNVVKGNVEIYGTVTEITFGKGAGTVTTYATGDVATLKKAIELIAQGKCARIVLTADIDLAAKSSEELTFEEHKTIDIKEGVTLQLGSANFLTAEKGLTLTGKGTLDNSAAASTAVVAAASDVHEHKSLIHVTGGDLLIDGVTLINDPEYHWHGSSYNTAAIAYWNDANVTIRNARVISGEFTLCGMGRNGANTATVTLIDSFFESTSSNLDNKQHWAYAMRLFGSEVLIENCEVKGIQGAVSIEENAKAEIRSGKFYTVNTSGQQDAFYALYVSSSAEVTITGGEFSAPNVRTGLQIEGTSAVVSGDNDTGRPSGSVILKGGKFSGKAYNHVTNTVYAPAAGYQWQAITDGDNLKWAVVPATR